MQASWNHLYQIPVHRLSNEIKRKSQDRVAGNPWKEMVELLFETELTKKQGRRIFLKAFIRDGFLLTLPRTSLVCLQFLDVQQAFIL